MFVAYLFAKLKSSYFCRFFRYLYDLLILANAICIGADFDVLEWFFLGAFILEILLKMYALGPVKFFKHFWNM